MYIYIYIYIDRQKDKQADRQTRQTDGQNKREIDRQTEAYPVAASAATIVGVLRGTQRRLLALARTHFSVERACGCCCHGVVGVHMLSLLCRLPMPANAASA